MIPSLPPDASADGHRIDALLALIDRLAGGGVALVLAALAALLWRYRARPGVAARPVAARPVAARPVAARPVAPAQRGDGAAHALATVAVAALVFAGVDLNVVRRAHADLAGRLWAFPRGPGVVRVQVLARRWAWSARYPGADGRFGTADDVVTLDDVRVPRGAPVYLQLQSLDVVHSLFLPNFRVKQDAVPRATRAWFRPVREGRYEIACAQLCGWAHYRMRGELTVLPPADFDRWLAARGADAVRSYRAGDAEARQAWAWED